MSKLTDRGSSIFAAVAGGTTAMGIIKTLLETTSGSPWSLQKTAFYVAVTTILIYVVLGAAVTVASMAAGAFEDNDTAIIIALIIGGAIGIYLALGADFVSYDEAGSGSRMYGAVLGIIVVSASVWIWTRLKKNEAKT